MAVRLRATLLGVQVEIDAPPELLRELSSRTPPGWATAEAPPDQSWRVTATGDDYRVRRGTTDLGLWPLETAAVEVMGDVELWVAEHTTEAVVVHAAVVAHAGRALVMPGRSMQGKSTLTAAMLSLGASFMSDEYALLDPAGQVRAYPRPVSMRPRADQPDRAPLRVPASEFDAPVESGPVPVALVVALRYDSALGLSLIETPPGQTALALIDNAVAAQTQKAAVMRTCALVAGSARGVSGTRGEADEAAGHLLEMLTRM